MSHYYEIFNSYVVIMYSLVQAMEYGVHYFFFRGSCVPWKFRICSGWSAITELGSRGGQGSRRNGRAATLNATHLIHGITHL